VTTTADTKKETTATSPDPDGEADEDDRLELRAATIKTTNVDEASAKVKELGEQLDALAAKLQDGDIDFAEYTKQSNELNDQIADLKADIKTAINEAERQRSAEQALWDRQCKAFFGEHGTKDGKGGLYDHAGMRYQALNAAVIQIANDPANAAKSGRAILKMAHERLIAEGLVPRETTTATTPVKGKPKVHAEVPTLAGKPAAEMADTSTNERFKALDALPQEQLERELGKLSEADRQAYLNS
jgi:DNA repair exonuclease SbcCD ATPase subunit